MRMLVLEQVHLCEQAAIPLVLTVAPMLTHLETLTLSAPELGHMALMALAKSVALLPNLDAVYLVRLDDAPDGLLATLSVRCLIGPEAAMSLMFASTQSNAHGVPPSSAAASALDASACAASVSLPGCGPCLLFHHVVPKRGGDAVAGAQLWS